MLQLGMAYFLPETIKFTDILYAFYTQRTFNKHQAFTDLALAQLGAKRNLSGIISVGELRTSFGWTFDNNVFVVLYANNRFVGLRGEQLLSNGSGGNQYCDVCGTQQDSSLVKSISFAHLRRSIGYRICNAIDCDLFVSGQKKPIIKTGYKIQYPPADDRRLKMLEFWSSLINRLNI